MFIKENPWGQQHSGPLDNQEIWLWYESSCLSFCQNGVR